ncbi:hypothetical protein [Roseimaritima sediminicola]|uniref:hypothetical protein n=1 Tax=Roseimaritima sediminicola TaxID=2662066 RepID=UPI00192A569B|nr:hypothetical protein [Roseimaritima sediminicola]
MIQSEHSIRFTHGNRGKRQLRSARPSQKTPGRIPRVTKLMALAIRLDQLIRDGVVADQAQLARLGYVSRARLTQIMNLLQLAPDIQEAILCNPTSSVVRRISEHDLRALACEPNWTVQRSHWDRLLHCDSSANAYGKSIEKGQ